MGVCESKEIPLKPLTYDHWQSFPSFHLPSCEILQSFDNQSSHLFVWFSPIGTGRSYQQQLLYKQREVKQSSYLPNIYEVGRNNQHYYIITQELVRLKEIKLSFFDGAVVAYEALKSYQVLLREYGGFVPTDEIIFINRQGMVKVWIHENLSKNEPAYPNPKIGEEEFVISLINSVNRRIEEKEIKRKIQLRNYSSLGTAVKQLKMILHQHKSKRVRVKEKQFNGYMQMYKMVFEERNSYEEERGNKSIEFMVGNKNEGNYVKKYQLENYNPFCKENQSDETFKGNQTNKTLESEKEYWNRGEEIIKVQSQLIVMKKEK